MQQSTLKNAIAKGRRFAIQAAHKSKALQMIANQLKLTVDEQFDSFDVLEEKGAIMKGSYYHFQQRSCSYDSRMMMEKLEFHIRRD